MKKLLYLPILLLSQLAYCEELYTFSDCVSIIGYYLKVFTPLIILLAVIFFVILIIILLSEWYKSDIENHPERTLIIAFMDIILGVLTLGLVWLNKRK